MISKRTEQGLINWIKKNARFCLLTLMSITTCFSPCKTFGTIDTSAIKFHGTEETLTKIMEIISGRMKGAYLRFGDGDINLATGTSDLLQQYHRSLSLEMKETFSMNGPTILKTLNLQCREFNGFEPGMFPGNHETPYEISLHMLEKAQPLWGKEITDVYSPVALHYAASHKKNLAIHFLKFLKKCNCVFIGNESIQKEVRDVLFGKDSLFIATPSENSYDRIDDIENECIKKIKDESGYKVIITAMGCSGRILQKRLWHKLDNVFLFDFGSLIDALCGRKTRAWIELTHFDGEAFLDDLNRDVKIVITAALIETQFEKRKSEYIETISILNKYGFKNPYIIESISSGKTFLDDYSENVIYPNVNNFHLRNKGVNEGVSIANSLDRLNFHEEDIVVKITGRYHFISVSFLKTIESNPSIDVFVKLAPDGQVYTGCFAMRYKYFRELFHQIDYKKMETEMINLETEVANYIQLISKTQNAQIMHVDRLGIIASIFGDGSRETIEL